MRAKRNINYNKMVHTMMRWNYTLYSPPASLLIYDAWKFSLTLKELGVINIGETLDDYLIVEFNSKEEAVDKAKSLPDVVKYSVWSKDNLVLESEE